VLAASPLGKVPFMRTDGGTLCESQVMVDYIEAAYPARRCCRPTRLPPPRCVSSAPSSTCTWSWWRASCTPRPSSAAPSATRKERVRKQLTKNIAGVPAKLAKFGALCGRRQLHPGRLRRLCQPAAGGPGHQEAVLGEDLLAAAGERYNPMGYDEARQMEVELAIALRARGFGVWQA
jgi:glutathione S-transferase